MSARIILRALPLPVQAAYVLVVVLAAVVQVVRFVAGFVANVGDGLVIASDAAKARLVEVGAASVVRGAGR